MPPGNQRRISNLYRATSGDTRFAAFYLLSGGNNMDDSEITQEQEQSLDELWAKGKTDETEAVVDATTDPLPDDDSDLLGDEPQTEADAANVGAPAGQFDLEAYLPRIAEYLQKEVLPSRDEQLLREAQNRARQSQKARDEQIKATLAPLVDHFRKLEQQGLYTREDSQREYAAAYKAVASETEAKEHAQQEAELRQRWLASQQGGSIPAQQQAPVPGERPIWLASTEARMNQILEQSGLTETDPEWASVPLSITHPDPNEALDYFRTKVASAVQERQKRLQATAKPKPMIDMGTGGGAGASNPLAGIEDTDQLWELAMRS